MREMSMSMSGIQGKRNSFGRNSREFIETYNDNSSVKMN